MSEYQRRGSLVWPVILIGLGVVLLLNNLGVLGWDVWLLLAQLWPLLLIAMGLDVLLGRRSVLGAVLSLIIILGLLAAGIWFFADRDFGIRGEITTYELTQPLEGASEAVVDIGFGLGALDISAMSDGSLLASGELMLTGDEEFQQRFGVEGEVATLRIGSQGRQFYPSWLLGPSFGGDNRTWEVRLTEAVPIDLRIDTGVGKSTVDLRGLTINQLEIDAGVGETVVYLPDAGSFEAHIDGGVGELRIFVPEGAAVRITVDSGLGNTSVQGDFDQDGSIFTSAGFDSAEEWIELFVAGGVGNVRIRQVER